MAERLDSKRDLAETSNRITFSLKILEEVNEAARSLSLQSKKGGPFPSDGVGFGTGSPIAHPTKFPRPTTPPPHPVLPTNSSVDGITLEAIKVQTKGAMKVLDRMMSEPREIPLKWESQIMGPDLISPEMMKWKTTQVACSLRSGEQAVSSSREALCATAHPNSRDERRDSSISSKILMMTTTTTTTTVPPPIHFNNTSPKKQILLQQFPPSLMLEEEDLADLARENPTLQFKNTLWNLDGATSLRSKSTEGLNDLQNLLEHRVRRSREKQNRRKSLSLGIMGRFTTRDLHTRDLQTTSSQSRLKSGETTSNSGWALQSAANSTKCSWLDTNDPQQKAEAKELFLSKRACSWNPSYLSQGSSSEPKNFSLPGEEKWPERICSYLTNGQRIKSRLKMFSHFSELMKSMEDERMNLDLTRHLVDVPSDLPLPQTRNLRLVSGAWTIGKTGKPNGGEDAFFHNADQAEFSFAGVADGVGEWGEYDCCPKQFACELMDGSKGKASELPFHTKTDNSDQEKASQRALKVLRAGFEKALTANDCFGSSTTLVAGLDAKGETLGVASLGDSTCIVLRRSQPRFKNMTIAKRTKEQQHFFNCPYQLSRLPMMSDLPTLEQRGLYKLVRVMSNMKPGMCSDSPEQADLTDLRVREGDLIVLGTDGLFDNLFDQEIISLASLSLSPFESKLFLKGQKCAKASTSSENTSDTSSGFASPERCDSSNSHLQQTTGGRSSAVDSARMITEAWVTGALPHPLAVEPPECSAQYGIATPPESVARGIAEAAYYRSIDGRARTPFAKAARAAGTSATGGKQDDITVVACWVVSGGTDVLGYDEGAAAPNTNPVAAESPQP